MNPRTLLLACLMLWSMHTLICCSASDETVDIEDTDINDDTDTTDTTNDTDTSGNEDSESDTNPATWVDESTGLEWEHSPSNTRHEIVSALAYCDNLELEGHTDWRLPNLSELRSLIRDCPDTITGGPCPITAECLEINDCPPWPEFTPCLTGCPTLEGNGPDGCYWPSELGGRCHQYAAVPYDWNTMYVVFTRATIDGHLGHISMGNTYFVRCVRTPEPDPAP